MSENYLIHWAKGKEAKNHKYQDRKWVNGAWQYIYETTHQGHANSAYATLSPKKKMGTYTGSGHASTGRRDGALREQTGRSGLREQSRNGYSNSRTGDDIESKIKDEFTKSTTARTKGIKTSSTEQLPSSQSLPLSGASSDSITSTAGYYRRENRSAAFADIYKAESDYLNQFVKTSNGNWEIQSSDGRVTRSTAISDEWMKLYRQNLENIKKAEEAAKKVEDIRQSIEKTRDRFSAMRKQDELTKAVRELNSIKDSIFKVCYSDPGFEYNYPIAANKVKHSSRTMSYLIV